MSGEYTCGQFKLDDEGKLWAPSAYMKEQGDALLAEILAGTCAGFNACLQTGAYPQSMPTEHAIVHFLQLDWANWHGVNGLIGSLR